MTRSGLVAGVLFAAGFSSSCGEAERLPVSGRGALDLLALIRLPADGASGMVHGSGSAIPIDQKIVEVGAKSARFDGSHRKDQTASIRSAAGLVGS
jgi:hypothetical protein